MPRQPRIILSHSYYHIISRGNNKNHIFRFSIDYFYYLDLLRKYKKELPFDLYHYCLMPNHVHLLIQTKNSHNFSTFMKKLNLSYFYYYQKNYGWTGYFWQGRFKSQPVGKDEYFIQCGKYIELNPVRANLVVTPEEYQFSSSRYYIQGVDNDIITPDFIYQAMGKTDVERQEKYKKLVISEEIFNNYNKTVWGSRNQRYNEARKLTYHIKEMH